MSKNRYRKFTEEGLTIVRGKTIHNSAWVKREREALKQLIKKKRKPRKPRKPRPPRKSKLPHISPPVGVDYKGFLKSPYWIWVRNMVLKRDNHTCKRCGGKKYLRVHHKTYRYYRSEWKHLDSLETLCNPCHRKEHGIE